jgi:hypothetical protein
MIKKLRQALDRKGLVASRQGAWENHRASPATASAAVAVAITSAGGILISSWRLSASVCLRATNGSQRHSLSTNRCRNPGVCSSQFSSPPLTSSSSENQHLGPGSNLCRRSTTSKL